MKRIVSLDLALYQPDIAQNTGTLVRLCACMGVTLHVIHPAGFALTEKNLARAGLDYVEYATIRQHDSFERFNVWRHEDSRRLVLLTTRSSQSAYAANYLPGDILMLGRESAGVPDDVHQTADLRLRIPLQKGARSLNVALAAAMVVSEALRQTSGFDALSD